MRKYDIKIDNKVYNVIVRQFSDDSALLEIDGHQYSLTFDGPPRAIMNGIQASSMNQTPVATASAQPIQPAQSSATPAPASQAKQATNQTKVAAGQSAVVAPIPGSIADILVKEGDQVEAGQIVLKMEAMKMENEIKADAAGIVSAINVSVGDAANQGDVLIVIE